jgi:NADPH:quinone reductase-like Zn-dependent oxidoreductase
VQLAAAAGAVVVAAVRDPDLRPAVADLGAQTVIDPADIGEFGPYDVVLELVGAATLPFALGALAPRGRVVVIGVGSGARVELNLFDLMARRARISASTLRARDRPSKAAVAARVHAHVLPLLVDGRVRVPVTAVFDMADAALAYERFAAGSKLGKVVLVR